MRQWPWITTVLAAAAIFNPLGLTIIQAALFPSATDWLAYIWQSIALAGVVIIIALGGLEWWIKRVLARRRAETTAGPRTES